MGRPVGGQIGQRSRCDRRLRIVRSWKRVGAVQLEPGSLVIVVQRHALTLTLTPAARAVAAAESRGSE